MQNKKNICVVTGTRADYGLLFWIMNEIKNSSQFNLQLIVTGMHLSPEFGKTYQVIENDGFIIDKKIEILLSSDTSTGISKSIGLGVISFAEALGELDPDLLFVLGDRFEIFSAVSAAMICRIPVAHCHGGEATIGLIDESIRHSITKMSHYHFTSTEDYRNRVIQLGELPSNVFNVGALGIESINKLKLLSKKEFEKSINLKLDSKINILVTYHPVTLEHASSKRQMKELLSALDFFKNSKIIFTKANSDTDGRIINQLIDEYVGENDNCVVYFSLGQLRYLSALKYVDVVVGNSSSGLLEVPSFNKPTVNIGERQKNRIKAKSVIDCLPERKEIVNSIEKSQKKVFQDLVRNIKSPYGEGNSSELIINVLEKIDYSKRELILKKEFHDIKFNK